GRTWIGVEFTDSFAIGSGPNSDVAGEVGGDDAFPVVTEDRAEREITGTLEVAFFGAAGIPENHGIVPAAGDEPAIMSVADRPCTIVVRTPVFGLFAFFHFPEFHGPVFAGGGEKFGITAPTQGRDGGF